MHRYILLTSALLLSATLSGNGQDPPPDATALSFANALMTDGDYYRAITEYKRYLHIHPDGPLQRQARLSIGRAYLEGGETDRGMAALDALAASDPDSPEATLARQWMVGSLYQQEHYHSALQLSRHLDLPEEHAASFQRLCHLRLNTPLEEEGTDIWGTAYQDLPLKSPGLAGSLSALLPGAGQLYVHRPVDGTWAFLLNGVFIGASVTAFNHDEPVAGGFSAVMAVVWYVGNVYNAVNGAHLYNTELTESFFEPIEHSLLYDEEAPLFQFLFPIDF